jgi:CheY-like chemotaxis protein
MRESRLLKIYGEFSTGVDGLIDNLKGYPAFRYVTGRASTPEIKIWLPLRLRTQRLLECKFKLQSSLRSESPLCDPSLRKTRVMPSKLIVLADDEQTVRNIVKAILQNDGFEVVESHDGVHALEYITGLHGAIDLLLTDVRMPRLDGIGLARAVTAMYPNIPVLYISGYSLDIEDEKSKHPKQACGFVQKPFLPKVLLEAVRKCLDLPITVSGTTA